jgi:hypothetical protein
MEQLMNLHETHRVQRLIAIFTVGICEAVRTGVVSIDEAEILLFSPHTIRSMEQIGAPAKMTDFIQVGTELDAVKRIVSQQEFMRSLERIRSEALSFLGDTKACDPQLEKWIELLVQDSSE